MEPKHTYRLIIQDVPYQVQPRGVDGLKIKSEAESGQIFHRRKLTGTFLLKDADYALLYQLEKSGDRCVPLYLEIIRNCDNQVEWTGIFSLNEVKWDLSRCEALITVRPNDKYRLVLDYYAKEYNVLLVPPTDPVKVQLDFEHQFEFKNITGGTLLDEPDSDTWAVFLEARYWIDGNLTRKGVRENNDIIFRLVTTRAYVNGEAPDLSGGGWKIVDTDEVQRLAKYAKAPDLYNFVPYQYRSKSDFLRYRDLLQVECNATYDPTRYVKVTGANAANSDACGGTCLHYRLKVNEDRCVALLWEFGTFHFDRNRQLLRVIKFLLNQTCPELEPATPEEISEFLTTPTNYVTGQDNQLLNLLIAQKSDILAWNSSEAATKGMLSLKNLLDDLKAMLDVRWFINAAGKFQLEHISYFENTGTLDLTQGEYAPYLRGQAKYEYRTEEMPRFEKLTFAEALNEDFEQGVIEYGGACVTYQEGQDTREINVTRLVTDLEYLLTSSGANKNGFVLLANRIGQIPKEAGHLTGIRYANAHLAAANLVHHYHTHNRVLYTGVVNGVPATFKSVQKTRKQTTLNLPTCCGAELNPYWEYITNLGSGGKLLSAEVSLKTGVAAVDIVFDTTGSGAFDPGRQFSDSFNDSFR